MNLPSDYTRCHDHACEKAHLCARYLDRDHGGYYSSHVMTFKMDGICSHFLTFPSCEGDLADAKATG